jgi:hypothetical protein
MKDRLIINTLRQRRVVRPGMAAVLGLATLLLAGCGGRPIQSEAFVKNVPAEQAMVMPPPAGPAIVSIIERRFDNAISQDIHLATSASTPGQNLIKVQIFGTQRTLGYTDNNLRVSSVTEGRIASEMRAAFPRVRMTRSQFFVQNNYGPFGYAFGRGPGTDLCIYAWQQIRSRTVTMSPLANYGVIQIRLRMCEAGATEAQLLSTMYNFTITATVDAPGWNPYGASRGLNPAIGSTSSPIYPRPTSAEPIVQTLPQRQSVAYAPRAQVRQVRAAPVSVPETQVTQPEFSPQRPRVPAPSGPGFSPEGANAVERSGEPASAGSATTAGQRVTVPSPSCSMTTDGANVVCR